MNTRRLLLLFAALVLLPVSVLAALSYGYIEGAEERLLKSRLEEFVRVSGALQRIVDDELREILKAEDQRDYYEYQDVYYADAQQQQLASNYNGFQNLSVSPLIVPENPLIERYFTLDGGNRVSTPMVAWMESRLANAEEHPGTGEGLLDSGSTDTARKQQQDDYAFVQQTAQNETLNAYQSKGGQQQCRATLENVVKTNRQVAEQRGRFEPQQAEMQQELQTWNDEQSKLPREQTEVTLYYTPFELVVAKAVNAPEALFAMRQVTGPELDLRQGFQLNLELLRGRIARQFEALRPADGGVRLNWQAADRPGGMALAEMAVHPRLPAELKIQLLKATDLASASGLAAGRRWFLALLASVVFVLLGGLYLIVRAVNRELQLAGQQQDFISAVSHELKTPLTGIRLYGEMLAEGMVPTDDRRQQYYRSIVSESERLSRLIHNVLDLARIEKGQKHYHKVRQPLPPVIESALAICQTLLEKAGFSVECRIDDGLPAVELDKDAMLQVVINLIDNAVKFSMEAPEKRLRVTARPVASGVEIRVEDAGPGIPAASRDRVFDRFRRGERELTRKTTGIGLGLALVREIVAAHGGSVEAVDSALGGAGIRILLPG